VFAGVWPMLADEDGGGECPGPAASSAFTDALLAQTPEVDELAIDLEPPSRSSSAGSAARPARLQGIALPRGARCLRRGKRDAGTRTTRITTAIMPMLAFEFAARGCNASSDADVHARCSIATA